MTMAKTYPACQTSRSRQARKLSSPQYLPLTAARLQVQTLLHVLCEETELAELELKVCHAWTRPVAGACL